VIAAVKASGRPLAAVLYVSDHGEDLLDGGCGKSGHGHATPQSVRVPLFFWYSDTYQQTFPEKVATLRRRSKEPLTTESVFPLLVDAAAIQFPTEDTTRSVMSPSFTRHAPRIFRTMEGSTINFDRAHQNAECELVN
jgi:glucan phosphoethanolaminetransferase (alkaline phosphatase superfamily)